MTLQVIVVNSIVRHVFDLDLCGCSVIIQEHFKQEVDIAGQSAWHTC